MQVQLKSPKSDIKPFIKPIIKGGIYRRFIKRPMDFILSLISIIILSPVFLFLAIIVRTKLGSPIFFKQQRPGLNGNIFTMYKFRTMTDESDKDGELLPDSFRLTKFGRFLRSTSLDELPELFNIVKGDMSIIGPRPLLVEYLPLYSSHQQRRHEVRPGLSGLAQVNGRNAISWEDKFDLDVQYVDRVTFIGDWKIIFLTIKKVLVREGINSETSVTMEPFKGSQPEGKKQKMKNKLLIIGASGHGKVIADIALKMNKWSTVAFLDDNSSIKSAIGLEVIGTSTDVLKYLDEYEIFVGIGNNVERERIHDILEKVGASIPTLIHPNSVVGEKVELGFGTVIMAGVVINCCTTIGKGCIINTGSTIDHDNRIEDFVHISPGVHLAGTVKVGRGSWLGIGSTVSNNLTITSDCIVGAGSVVVKDISETGVYVGVPVRRVRQ